MGGGIIPVSLQGTPIVMKDINQDALDLGMGGQQALGKSKTRPYEHG